MSERGRQARCEPAWVSPLPAWGDPPERHRWYQRPGARRESPQPLPTAPCARSAPHLGISSGAAIWVRLAGGW